MGAASAVCPTNASCDDAHFTADKQRRDKRERSESEIMEERHMFPIVSKAEVAKHRSVETGGVWVTYAGGVYDITEFIANHPGGASRIRMAAGGALEPFWQLYALHKKDEVTSKSIPMLLCDVAWVS